MKILGNIITTLFIGIPVILVLMCIYFKFTGNLVIPDNRPQYRIIYQGYWSEVDSYTEKDGCIYFNDMKACGSYIINPNK